MTVARVNKVDVLIVGAGFGGMYMLHRCNQLGLRAVVYEAASGVGGTWYWNRYPGARCDVESMEYCYQFDDALQQEWEWTERYAAQPEILRYLNHVADRFDLRKNIIFNTRVERAHFSESGNFWSVEADNGDTVEARYCVFATGCLSSFNTPDFPGLAEYQGEVLTSSDWPKEKPDLEGKRVGVIGTGSSAIQLVPFVAEEARHLYVFQRTANHVVPAHNGPLSKADQDRVKADYPAFRHHRKRQTMGMDIGMNPRSALEVSEQERQAEYEARWAKGGVSLYGAFSDLLFNPAANDTATEFVSGKIREMVHDQSVAEKLVPKQAFACKRLCFDLGYMDTFNRENVTLVDVKNDPIDRFEADALLTSSQRFELDVVILATGFDAMTGALDRIDIRGRNGLTLKEKWSAGPVQYLGLCASGFPNMFMVTGPGSPSVFTNMVPSIEQHVDWISNCIQHMKKNDVTVIEAKASAEEGWVERVNEIARETIFPSCNSWYLGANIPGKPRVFMPYIGFDDYCDICEEVVRNNYRGFALN